MNATSDKQPEFDQYVNSYQQMHKKSIGFSGESLDYFARYKIEDVQRVVTCKGLGEHISILDFGAGTGTSIPYWKIFFKEASVSAADVSGDSLSKLTEAFPDCRTLLIGEGKIPVSNESFDVVFASGVFHHINHSEHHANLVEILRVLKKGGLFFVFEHNPLNPLTLYAVDKCEFDINAHLIKPWQMKNRMKAAGFQDCFTRFRIFFPGFLSLFRPLERFLPWLPLGGQYFVCGVKR